MSISRRSEHHNFGKFETTQTYYTCSACNVETNLLEWFIRQVPKQEIAYTCPNCKTEHILSLN